MGLRLTQHDLDQERCNVEFEGAKGWFRCEVKSRKDSGRELKRSTPYLWNGKFLITEIKGSTNLAGKKTSITRGEKTKGKRRRGEDER